MKMGMCQMVYRIRLTKTPHRTLKLQHLQTLLHRQQQQLLLLELKKYKILRPSSGSMHCQITLEVPPPTLMA